MPVLLDLGCCPAGTSPELAVREGGGKAVVVVPAGPATARHEEESDPLGWAGRLADLLGMHAEAVAAGCPVPLVEQLLTWSRAASELEADRWDAVVVPCAPRGAAALLEAPAVVRRVADARLDALVPVVGEDAAAGQEVARLLQVRRDLEPLSRAAAVAVVAGHPEQHRRHGCRERVVGTATSDPEDVAAPVRPGAGVRAEADHLVWWLAVPEGARPEVHREDDRLLVRLGDRWRELTLPSALTRCTATAATVVADRLEVRFTPDPDAWR